MYNILADAVIVVHFLFVLFVIFGAFTLFRFKKMIILHLPAAVWGAMIEFSGWICPLTPLENRLRHMAGQQTYQGGFIEHYIVPILYPAALTREIQYVLGTIVISVNVIIYWQVFRPGRRKQVENTAGSDNDLA